jgi:hypothetical protein
MGAAVASVDALLLPTAIDVAPGLETTGAPSLQAPFSLVGLPSMSLPSGLLDEPERLPLAVQLVAGAWQEPRLLSVARWCETQLPTLPSPLPTSAALGLARLLANAGFGRTVSGAGVSTESGSRLSGGGAGRATRQQYQDTCDAAMRQESWRRAGVLSDMARAEPGRPPGGAGGTRRVDHRGGHAEHRWAARGRSA